MDYNLYDRLSSLLIILRRKVPGNIFTGAGVVVYEHLNNLPLLKLSRCSDVSIDNDTLDSLIDTSVATNPEHDGFSLLDKELSLTHKNVYFNVPIDPDVKFDVTKGYGTRYAAAIMASKVEGIIMTAVVSNSYGVKIFKDGVEIGMEK